MKGKLLRVESLERRELLTGVCTGPLGDAVMTQACVQLQNCAAECAGPVQEQTQTQTQEQTQTQLKLQDGTCDGPIQTQEQTQTQLKLQEGAGEGEVQTQLQTQAQQQVQTQLQSQLQTQLQTQTQLQNQAQTQTQSQTQTQTQQQGPLTDAAIESLAADDTDPLRQRSGDTAHPENGMFVRDRDGVSWP
ncbi:MAG: hypothetical protein GXX96_18055 [Planctomycetaceae bacterium]|nr:hypothetical protein [Planctomycetaceae bacterium]